MNCAACICATALWRRSAAESDRGDSQRRSGDRSLHCRRLADRRRIAGEVRNSIVDATSETAVAYSRHRCRRDTNRGGTVTIEIDHRRQSAHGGAQAGLELHFLCRARDRRHLDVAGALGEKQSGCVRFSYVPPGSLTPRRYRCQPDLEIASASTPRKKPPTDRFRRRKSTPSAPKC